MRANLQILQNSLDQGLELESGFEFLEAKLMVTVSLCVQLMMILIKKINGDQIEDSTGFTNLMYFRELFKRLRPIQEKLTNHIEDMCKSGTTVT